MLCGSAGFWVYYLDVNQIHVGDALFHWARTDSIVNWPSSLLENLPVICYTAWTRWNLCYMSFKVAADFILYAPRHQCSLHVKSCGKIQYTGQNDVADYHSAFGINQRCSLFLSMAVIKSESSIKTGSFKQEHFSSGVFSIKRKDLIYGLITSPVVRGLPDSQGCNGPVRPPHYELGSPTAIALPQLPGKRCSLAVAWPSGAR